MTMRTILLPVVLIGSVLCAGVLGQGAGEEEAKRIAVLKSDAALKAKVDACRELTVIGTKDCVPVLAGLLDDEKLRHMARYALEPIRDGAVDEALRKALGTLKGRPLVGVIGSVGVRRDTAATAALAGFLGDGDPEVAQAAARALGRMGTPAAAEALTEVLKGAPAANRPAVVEGLFRCAEAIAAAGKPGEAMAIYDRLRKQQKLPHQVRTGALRGAVLTRGDEGLPLLVEALRSDDFRLVGAAVRIGQEAPGSKATEALAQALGKLSPDSQILLSLTLGKRGDSAALPQLFALARKGETAARIAAIRGMTEIGHASAVPVLIKLHADAAQEVALAAQNALAALAGPEADSALVNMLAGGAAGAKVMAAELIGRRRMAGAVPELVKAAGADDEAVRVACLEVLGELAGAKEFPVLVRQLVAAKSAPESKACEQALAAICTRLSRPDASKVKIIKAVYGDLPNGTSRDVAAKVAAMVKDGKFSVAASNTHFGDPIPGTPKSLRLVYSVDGVVNDETVPEKRAIEIRAGAAPTALADALLGALEGTSGTKRLALLRVLRAAGGAKALATVSAAVADAGIRKEAVAILCGWPTPDALPQLMRLAASAKSTRDKVLALRGCCRLVPMQNVPAEAKAETLKGLLGTCERVDEKRLALSALGAVPGPEALAVVVPYLESAQLKEEACLAAVGISEAIAGSHGEAAAAAMKRVVAMTGNKGTSKRARAVLRRTK